MPFARRSGASTVISRCGGYERWIACSTRHAAARSFVLAAIGVYGVMSYGVARRTQEVGIRMALGARRGQVLGMVLREGMRTIGVALIVGLATAAAATRLIASQLFGVSAVDPLTFVLVPVLLAIVALAACYLPARRASRIDPIIALRAD